jgi:hypothetical protein
MSLFKAWKQLKAVGWAANEAAAHDASQRPPQQPGFMSAFANVMAQALGPQLAATAANRGGPLPGTEAGVADGTAWAAGVDASVEAVRARDAAFDPGPLTSFADQVFAALVSVWNGANASSIRPVMSDDLWEPLAAATGTGKEVPMARFQGSGLGSLRPISAHGQHGRTGTAAHGLRRRKRDLGGGGQ